MARGPTPECATVEDSWWEGCDRRCRVHVHGVSGSLSLPSSSPVVLVVAMLAGRLGEAARASSAMGARVDACAGAAWASLFRVSEPCRLSRFCAFCAGSVSKSPLLAAASFPAKDVLCTESPGVEPSVEPVSLLSTPIQLSPARALDPLSDHADVHAWPGMGGNVLVDRGLVVGGMAPNWG